MPSTTVDLTAIAEAGAVGAGISTHVKLAGKADAVLINAGECEPLLDKDKEGLHAYGDEVLEGLQAAMRLVGASQGWIGIKEKYEDVIEAMRPKLTRGVEIALLPYSYPAGDECVQVGQRVTQGQVIGRPPVRHGKPALGVPVHTSIDDTVSSVRDGVAWLQRTWP